MPITTDDVGLAPRGEVAPPPSGLVLALNMQRPCAHRSGTQTNDRVQS